MREQEVQTGIRVLLIGDTHPEMISIARNLSRRDINYKIVLPTYFTVQESQTLVKFKIGYMGLQPWLQKRTLDPCISSDSMIRTYAALEAFTWLAKKFGYHQISWKFANLYNRKLTKRLPRIIESINPEFVVSYDTIKVPRSNRFKHIVICPMSHPIAVKESLIQSKNLFPNWPEMDDEKPLGINETAQFADRVVVLSQFAKNTYVSQGFEESKLEVIHIGPINGNKDSQLISEGENEFLRILFLGRMTRIKGVEALARLSDHLDPLKFQISLVGQCSPIIAKYIRSISNSDVLTLNENPAPNEISRFYSESDVFALPSFNEGFNISSLEAMSYGLVPVLSKNAGVSEILENTSLERLIIEPGSIAQLLESMNYLSSLGKKEFHALAKFSFEHSRKFTFEKFADDFVDLMLRESSK